MSLRFHRMAITSMSYDVGRYGRLLLSVGDSVCLRYNRALIGRIREVHASEIIVEWPNSSRESVLLGADVIRICAQCKREDSDHIGKEKKCPFASTTWA